MFMAADLDQKNITLVNNQRFFEKYGVLWSLGIQYIWGNAFSLCHNVMPITFLRW